MNENEVVPITIVNITDYHNINDINDNIKEIKNDLYVYDKKSVEPAIYTVRYNYSISRRSKKLSVNDAYAVTDKIYLNAHDTILTNIVNISGVAIALTDANETYYEEIKYGSSSNDDEFKKYSYTAEKECYVVISYKYTSGEPKYIDIIHNNMNDRFSYVNSTYTLIGNNENPAITYINGLIHGNKYRVYIHTTTPSYNFTSSDNIYRFVINFVDKELNNLSDIIRIYISSEDTIKPFYDFVCPENIDIIRIAVRCDWKEYFICSVKDITNEIDDIHNHNNFYYNKLNVHQFKLNYKIYGSLDDVNEMPDTDYFLTPFFRISANEYFEVDSIYTDSATRIASYDENFNYLGSYTFSYTPRNECFTKLGCTYLRASFRYDCIGAYIKIHNNVVFEWTEELRDYVYKYYNIREQASPLLKNYIICNGTGTPRPTRIDNVLPNHTYRIYIENYNEINTDDIDQSIFIFSVRSYNNEDIHTSLLAKYKKDGFQEHFDITTLNDTKYITLRARSVTGYKIHFYIEDITSNGILSSNDNILILNPDSEFIPKLQSANKRYYTSSDTTKLKPIVFSHISDIHRNWTNVKRFLQFNEHHKDYIDMMINTGDTVNAFTEGFEDYSNIPGVEQIINVIGNHDTHETAWREHIGPDVYNILISPYVQSWNVTQPDNANTYGYCYFYKDFVDNKLRFIFVDIMQYDDTENLWLSQTLDDAYNNGYDVIICTHFAGA